MFKFMLIACFLMIPLTFAPLATAQDGCLTHDCSSCHTLGQKEASVILKSLNLNVKSVKQSPVKGMFEVLAERGGAEGLIFIDYGKKYFMQGVMVDAQKLDTVSSHPRPLPAEKKVVTIDPSTIPVQHSFVMGNPGGSKKIYVFTDPDCPYCRKAHADLKNLAKIAPDVAIHIMLYPLPMHPAAFDKARTVLEKKNLEILDSAFEGKDVPKPTQDSSKKAIDEIIAFANANGINGTPTVVMPDGKIEVGIRDAETMKKMLEGK